MNRSTALSRKLIYLVVLVAMLVPLYLLGQPAGGGSDVGGTLSVMRHDFNIAESDLGEISPASQTAKLASLGLRGVAATLLWNKAHEYRVTHEWDRLKAVVNQIALLQPNSDKVWEFHSHNLTYNVSTEFDDYRQRYEMVREGTEFLQKGVRQNRNATRLVWYTGWFYGSKMGMADEKRQFRRLFADDDVLHERLLEENIAVDSPEARGPLGKPDNWLVGRLWLRKGYDLVDDEGVNIRRQTPLNFYETGPKWRIKHAEAIEKEGILDDRSQARWQMAAEDWTAFGNRSIPTTAPFTIKLGHLEELRRQRQQRLDELEEITGDVYQKARQKKIDELPADLKTVWDKPASQLTPSEKKLVDAIEVRVVPNLESVAKESDPKVRLRAISLVGEIADLDARGQKTDGYRKQINYTYWQTLAQAEQEERTIKARKMIYDAEQANANAELDAAIKLYEEAFEIWADIFDDYPILTIDDTADDLADSIRHYMVAIDSEDFPEDFPLLTFVHLHAQSSGYDSESYLEIRDRMEQDAEARRKELEEEEKRREQEAANDVSPDESAASEPADGNAADAEDAESPEASEATGSEDAAPKPEDEAPKLEDEASKADDSEDKAAESEEPATEESPDAETADAPAGDAPSSDAEPSETDGDEPDASGDAETSE